MAALTLTHLLLILLVPFAEALLFTNPRYQVSYNVDFTLQWTGANGGVTVHIVSGTQERPTLVQEITNNNTAGSYTFKPDSSLGSGTYRFQGRDSGPATVLSNEWTYAAPNTSPSPIPSPTPSPSPNPNPSPSQETPAASSGGLSTGAAAGIGVGVAIAAMALILLAGLVGYRKGHRKGRGIGLVEGAALRESAAAVALAGKDRRHDEENGAGGANGVGAPNEGYYGTSVHKGGPMSVGSGGGVGGSVAGVSGITRAEPMGDDVLGGGKEHVAEFGHGGQAERAGPSHVPGVHMHEMETPANVPEIAGRGDEGRQI